MQYIVKRAKRAFEAACKWDSKFWQNAKAIELKNYMGQKPEHFPKVQAKVLYDDEFVYVIFNVNDRFVRATTEKYNDGVCGDSCVEFFFTTGADSSVGYFNIEINCIGTILMNYQAEKNKNRVLIDPSDAEQIKKTTSLKGPITEEITEPVDWILEYAVPIDMLAKHAKVEKPAPGVIWRANFYKCADRTSHPHWLTWSPVELPVPDFHQPKFFGTLEFE